MTVVLSVVSDNWSILMTDTRMTLKNMSNKEYDDSVVKLKSLNYPHGWYAGTGYSPYIDAFYYLASRCLISSSQQYLDAMAQIIAELVQEQQHSISDIVNSTCLRTFIVEEQVFLEIFFIDKNTGITYAHLYPKDQILVLFPADYSSDMQLSLKQNYLIEEIRHESLESSFEKLLNIFKEITINSNAVSEICEIGILKKDGPIKKFSLSGNIHELIEKVEKQNIFANIF